MSPCLLIFGTKGKQMRNMFIILGEPILAGEQSRYSGMQCRQKRKSFSFSNTQNLGTCQCHHGEKLLSVQTSLFQNYFPVFLKTEFYSKLFQMTLREKVLFQTKKVIEFCTRVRWWWGGGVFRPGRSSRKCALHI